MKLQRRHTLPSEDCGHKIGAIWLQDTVLLPVELAITFSLQSEDVGVVCSIVQRLRGGVALDATDDLVENGLGSAIGNVEVEARRRLSEHKRGGLSRDGGGFDCDGRGQWRKLDRGRWRHLDDDSLEVCP